MSASRTVFDENSADGMAKITAGEVRAKKVASLLQKLHT
jgi:hypothetical protein